MNNNPSQPPFEAIPGHLKPVSNVENILLNAALDYTNRGWHVNPLIPKDKTPLLTQKNWNATWKNYRETLPSQAEVNAWWKQWPDANIMIICGSTSRIVVLDIDGQEGQETLARFQDIYGMIPKTPVVSTGKGHHYYFKHPGFEVKNFTRKAPGLDLRADGGYVVAPPSVHPSGAVYEWLNGPNTPLADIPEWLLDLIHDEKQQKFKYEAKVKPDEVLAGVVEGSRNRTLFEYTSRLRAQGISQTEAEILVKQAGANCSPPLPEKEIDTIINSVWSRYPAGAPKAETFNPNDWRANLKYNKKGCITEDPSNVILVLENDIRLKDKIRLNLFTNKIEINGKMPWFQSDQYWNDAHRDALCNYLYNNYGYRWTNRIDMALSEFVNKNAYHPVRDYLNSLVWDSKPRVESLLIDFMGSEDNDYVRTVTRITFVACVARVYEPGIKFDTILTLVGEQGGGKSTLLSKLAKDWFSDSISDIGNKDALQLLQGNWIIELGELSAIKKADIEHLKQFITRQVDEFRPPYGRITQRFPRQCVFFGTTNKVGFLSDPTGGRRFLPVHCGPKEITAEKVNNLTRDYVDQFWAEVVYLYKRGERLYLNQIMSGEAEKIRRGFEQDEPLAGVIERYLDLPLPPNWESLSISERRYFVEHEVTFKNEKGNKIRNQVCVAEIAVECLGLEQGQIVRSKSNEITDILTKLEGWEKSSQGVRIKGYGRQRIFVRSGTNFC